MIDLFGQCNVFTQGKMPFEKQYYNASMRETFVPHFKEDNKTMFTLFVTTNTWTCTLLRESKYAQYFSLKYKYNIKRELLMY